MRRFFKNHKQILTEIIVLIAAFIFISLAFYILKPLYFARDSKLGSMDGVVTRVVIFVCIIALFITGFLLKFNHKLSTQNFLFLIFILGVLLQLNYMLITPTPYNYRQHDVFSGSNAGHEGYAITIFATGKLPTQLDKTGHLDYQFYHPPFNALMQALFMRINIPFMKLYNLISGNNYYDIDAINNFSLEAFNEANAYALNGYNNPYNQVHNPGATVEAWEAANNYVKPMRMLFQVSEILSCYYMCIALFFAIKIAYRLKVDDKFKIIGAFFVALFPALMILAGQVNNDPLCIMNCFIVIYFTIRWWENHTYFNAAMIGLFTGLAMFAKLSGALIAVPAIVAFAYVIIKKIIDKESFIHFIIQGIMIGLIICPLGLWFHIYAKVRFDQPFGFVFSNLTNDLYVGNYSFFQRFMNIFDFKDMFTNIWGNTFVNYNLPNFMIKSAVFGEYSFICSDALAFLSLLFNYIFVYLSLILMIIYFACSKTEHLEVKIVGGVLILSQLIAQLYFNIKMPYGCTMDFRYIVPIILGFMILDVLAFDKFSKEYNWKKYYSYVVLGIGTCFSVSVGLFYLTAI